MTKADYKHLKELTQKLIFVTNMRHLTCDEIINDAYIKLIDKKKEYSYDAIARIIIGLIKYRFPDNYLSLDDIYAKTRNFSENCKVCVKCPQKEEQPISNFSVRQRLLNGVILYEKQCKNCINKLQRRRYLKRKTENKELHEQFLQTARGRYKKKMELIKKKPKLHEQYNKIRREANNIYNNKNRSEKIKNGWRPKQTSIAVIAIDMEGNLVKQFDSIGAAARCYGGHISNYINALKGRRHTASGFYWRYFNAPGFSIPKQRPKKGLPGKRVMAIDEKGKMIMKFESIKNAAKHFGGYRANYVKALKNKNRKAKGYYWRHCT